MTEAIHPHSSFSWIKHCRFLRLWILSSFINVISLILSKGKKNPKSKVSKHQEILISSTPFAHTFKSYGALFVKPGKSNCSLANSSSSGSRNSREVIMALLFVRLHLGITSLPRASSGPREVDTVEQVQWRDTKIPWGLEHNALRVAEEAGRV